MRNILLILGAIIILSAGFILLKPLIKTSSPLKTVQNTSSPQITSDVPQTSIVAENLDTPWAIAFLPDKSMLVTERAGRIRRINSSGQLEEKEVAVIGQAKEIGEGGLLGIALHPNFISNNFIYLYYTYSESGNNTLNRVVRMRYENNSLTDEKIIVDKIPGALNHNGGRIKFGPDKNLYITTGDAGEPSLSQDKNSLAGKILRVTSDTQISVYSYGHRNPQGLAWDSQGKLWATEHGQSAQDEVNIVYFGKNYGWPTIRGNETRESMETPILNSGLTTWAPAGAAFFNNSLFFGGLRGQTLYEAVINDTQIILKEHFKGQFGRIREVILGPDNMLYITTSNQDGRGKPNLGDDKVIKINPQKL